MSRKTDREFNIISASKGQCKVEHIMTLLDWLEYNIPEGENKTVDRFRKAAKDLFIMISEQAEEKFDKRTYLGYRQFQYTKLRYYENGIVKLGASGFPHIATMLPFKPCKEVQEEKEKEEKRTKTIQKRNEIAIKSYNTRTSKEKESNEINTVEKVISYFRSHYGIFYASQLEHALGLPILYKPNGNNDITVYLSSLKELENYKCATSGYDEIIVNNHPMTSWTLNRVQTFLREIGHKVDGDPYAQTDIVRAAVEKELENPEVKSQIDLHNNYVKTVRPLIIETTRNIYDILGCFGIRNSNSKKIPIIKEDKAENIIKYFLKHEPKDYPWDMFTFINNINYYHDLDKDCVTMINLYDIPNTEGSLRKVFEALGVLPKKKEKEVA